MTNPNPVNMSAFVRQRLKNIADDSGRPGHRFADLDQLPKRQIRKAVPGTFT